MKTIKMKRVNAKQLAALEARGIKVMIVNDTSTEGQLKGLERAASNALKQGNIDKAKDARLKMLKLIHNKNKGEQ